MKRILLIILTLMLGLSAVFSYTLTDLSSDKILPTAYKGRIRPIEAYSRLWLHDFYHHQEIQPQDRGLFHVRNGSALELIWKMHFLGHTPWDNTPLFWIRDSTLKKILGLDIKTNTFSYSELYNAIYETKHTNLSLMRYLLTAAFFKSSNDPSHRSNGEKRELTSLSPGLWVMLKGNALVLAAAPNSPPWNFLKPNQIIADNGRQLSKLTEKEQQLVSEKILNLLSMLSQYRQILKSPEDSLDIETHVKELQQKGISPKEIALTIESKYPFAKRLNQGGALLKVLPGKINAKEWFSLSSLKLKIYDPESQSMVLPNNFTQYSDDLFKKIQEAYLELDKIASETDDIPSEKIKEFSSLLKQGYQQIENRTIEVAEGKSLSTPSFFQLKTETIYYQIPLIKIAILAYGIALTCFLLNYVYCNRFLETFSLGILIFAFIMHTILLCLRCLILHRPPVSNMFETVIYVPWITMLVGFAFRVIFKSSVALIASSFVALILLIVLELTNLNSGLENVQAVLDSQYWLTTHVLMIVGSYGIFCFSGVLGHIYLFSSIFKKVGTPNMKLIGKLILQSLYLGVALLIPGTILGGVWAAESWGRFWDWDPKESWAFISSCVYLIWIHAYTFNYIQNFGLAVGSIVGLLAISFTWYGVNYILGTGLHSYGFGSGGEYYYFLFLLAELSFLAFAIFTKIRAKFTLSES